MEEPLDDHSFEEFLKGRLENLEADPAADAWDKIFNEISQDSPAPVQKTPWFVKKLWILAACVLWLVPQDTHHITLQPRSSSPSIASSKNRFDHRTMEEKGQTTHKNTAQAQVINPQFTQEQSIPSTPKVNIKPQSQPKVIAQKKKNLAKTLAYQHQPMARNTQQKQANGKHLSIRQTGIITKMAGTKQLPKKQLADDHKTPHSNISHTTTTAAPHPKDSKRTRLLMPPISPLSMQAVALSPYKRAALNMVSIANTSKKTSRSLLLRAFVAPTYNAHRLTTNKEDNEIIEGLTKNKAWLGNQLGFSGGLMFERHLSRRWSIVWGLSYTKLNNQIRYTSTNTLPDSIAVTVVNDSQVRVTPIYNAETKNYRYNYQDIGVQLGVNYLLFGKHWQHQLYIGAAANRVTSTITQTQDQVIKENSSRIQRMINVGYDMRIPLGRRFGFYLKPTFNYYLNAIEQANTAYQVKPFFTSLRLGFVWKLK